MKKYVAKWKRKKIVISQDDYKILLERFDINNFETINGRLLNRIPCPLCHKYKDCRGCTFDLYRKEVGCIKIMTEVLKEINQKPFENMFIDRNSIWFWLHRNVEEGKRAVASIREFLITKFKAVEE